MWESIDVDRHYIGAFNILDEEISGELIYNKQNGVILLNITKEINLMTPIGKMYGNIPA